MNRHIELLAQAPDPLVRSLVANRVSEFKTINQLLSDSDEHVRSNLVYNRQLRSAQRLKFSTDPSEWVRLSVAHHPQSPPESLTLISQDSDESIRQEVAKNPSTPELALDVLAISPDPVLREMVGSNPSTNLNTVNQLLDDHEATVAESAEAALLIRELKTNPIKLTMDAEEVKQLPVAAQKFLARYPQTSPATLDALSRESSTEVQDLAARHSQTPFAALKYLLSLDKDQVTQALSFNTSFTTSVEDHQEIYRRIKKWLIELQNLERLSPELRDRLRSTLGVGANSESRTSPRNLCRRTAKNNRNIHFLTLFEQLGSPDILQHLAANRNIPPSMLDNLCLTMGTEFGNKPSPECLRCMYNLSTNPYSSIKSLKLLADVTTNILAKTERKNTTSDDWIFPWKQISGIATGLVINPSTPESTKDMLTHQLIS